MLKSLTSREKNTVILAVTVLFCVFAYIYIFTLFFGQYNKIKSDTSFALGRLKYLKSVKNGLGLTNVRMKEMKDKLVTYRKQIPESTESAELLFYLNQAAQKSGVVLNKFDLSVIEKNSDKKTGTDKNTVKTTISVTGSFVQIRNFLVQTEELPRLTHNNNIAINEIAGTPRLECIIELTAFRSDINNSDIKSVSRIPKGTTGKQSLFKY